MAGMGGMDPRMMQALMSDPEIMSLMSKPGMMQKLQAIMADPSSAQRYAADPDVMAIINKFQALGMGGGPAPPPSAYPSSSSSSASKGSGTVTEITSTAQFNQIVDGSPGKLVVVDFFATWCGPCKAIAPHVQSMASAYPAVTFIKVDGDKNRSLAMIKKIEAYPTFHFYKNGSLIDEVRGADPKQLENLVIRYMDVEEVKEEVSPFRSFPLKEEEVVKYDTIKWDIVESKIEEFGKKIDGPLKLESVDLTLIHSLCDTLSRREEYLQTSIADDEFDVVLNKLLRWSDKCLPPVLNLLRCGMFHPNFAQHLIKSPSFLDILLKLTESPDTSELNLTQILQFLCNCMTRRSLSVFVLEKSEAILNSTATLAKRSNKVKQAYACLLLNFGIGIMYRKKALKAKKAGEEFDFSNTKIQVLSSAIELLSGEESASAIYRLLVVVGTLIYRDEETKTVAATMDLEQLLDGYLSSTALSAEAGLKEVCNELKRCLAGEA
jgi:thioredoxin 1